MLCIGITRSGTLLTWWGRNGEDIMSKTTCVALCMGYGDNSRMAWMFFTHHLGFDTPADALKSLASELVRRFKSHELKLNVLNKTIGNLKEIEPVTFIAWLNMLSRGSWKDYGNPDAVDGTPTRWWPFTEVGDILGLKREEILVVPMMGSEVVLAAHNTRLLTEFDVIEITDNMKEIASMLNVRHVDQETFSAIVGDA